MRDADRAKFTVLIEALAATFGREATEPLFEGYWVGLRDLPMDAVLRAASTAIREQCGMPTPAKLRELAGEMRPEDRALKAWGAVTEAMRGHDYYDTVVFDDPVTTATIRCSWHDWMMFSETFQLTDEVWVRKEFERVYCSLMRSGVNREMTRPLLGFYEKDNSLHGYRQGDKMRGYAIDSRVTIRCGLPILPALQRLPADHTERIEPAATSLLEHIGKLSEK